MIPWFLIFPILIACPSVLHLPRQRTGRRQKSPKHGEPHASGSTLLDASQARQVAFVCCGNKWREYYSPSKSPINDIKREWFEKNGHPCMHRVTGQLTHQAFKRDARDARAPPRPANTPPSRRSGRMDPRHRSSSIVFDPSFPPFQTVLNISENQRSWTSPWSPALRSDPSAHHGKGD